MLQPLRVRWCRLPAATDPRPAARQWLRQALAQICQLPPAALPLQRVAGQPPRLAGWSVSFTHTDGLAALAARPGSLAIGIDAESLQRPLPGARALRRVLQAEELAALQRLPEQARGAAFVRWWTAREAASKALGLGIWQGLAQLQATADGNWLAHWPHSDRPPLQVHAMRVAADGDAAGGHQLALAWPAALQLPVEVCATDPRGVPLRQASEQ